MVQCLNSISYVMTRDLHYVSYKPRDICLVESTGICTSLRNPKAFIFTLTNPHNIPPTKYHLTEDGYSITNCDMYGIWFGGGGFLLGLLVQNNGNIAIYFPNSFKDTTGKGNKTFVGSEGETPIEKILVYSVKL